MKILENKNAVLVTGQRLNCHLCGGTDGIIWKIEGQQTPETIQSLGGGALVMGGHAEFHIVFDNGNRVVVPESIVRGVQWTIYDAVASTAEIVDALRFADAEAIREKEEAQITADHRAAERDRLRAEHTHLRPVEPKEHAGAKLGAVNIRAELKAAFPGIKFSVRSDVSSIDIHWTLGPMTQEVEKITSKYKQGTFDGMTDSYDYNHDNVWPGVFGGARYVFCHHDTEPGAMERIAEALCRLHQVPIPGDRAFWNVAIPGTGEHAATLATRILLSQSYPARATITGLETVDDKRADPEDRYRATFTTEDQPAPQPPAPEPRPEGTGAAPQALPANVVPFPATPSGLDKAHTALATLNRLCR